MSLPLSPFRHRAFTVVWIATVVSNIGTWMQSSAAGWLMTSIDSEPRIVAMVQVATALPIFLLALPAGALADILDRRRLLLSMEIVGTLLTAGFAVLVTMNRVTPGLLLAFIFVASSAAALIAPAWQAVVPQLVDRKALAPAVALNSTGFNISRAIGPALGGLIIAQWSISWPFWLNALSNVGVIGALIWWRTERVNASTLRPESLWSAIIAGLRYARHSAHLRATLVRATGFFVFASAYWALLPLVARTQVAGGPKLYGLLLGTIGAGAVAGAVLMPRVKSVLGPDRLVAAGSVGTAIAMVLFGVAHEPAIAYAASFIAGASWIVALATINVSAQVALPNWVRGRGLAVYATAMFGALTIGSAIWGEAASQISVPWAHYIAAVGMLAAIPLLGRWKLQTAASLDLTPSMHWPEPVLFREIQEDRGPVLILVEYRIAPFNRESFLAALNVVAAERKRDGAYQWGVFEDASEEGRWVETFLIDSWLEHLRQHERVSNADRVLESGVLRLQTGGPPKITHLIAANPKWF